MKTHIDDAILAYNLNDEALLLKSVNAHEDENGPDSFPFDLMDNLCDTFSYEDYAALVITRGVLKMLKNCQRDSF